MRMSLPPGTELIGKKSKYIVDHIENIGDRAVLALCTDKQGREYRVKVFDGGTSINGESYHFFEEVKSQGLLPLVDCGDISGRPFFIFNNYNVQSVGQQVISIDLLANRIIPQISYVLNQIHSKRYVVRDISEEHILFDANAKEIMLVGLGNFTKLQGKATTTKEEGFGQHYSYIAPEVEKYGYSFASDYFSLGVTLLSIIRGRNVIQDITQKQFYDGLMAGKVPGIDVNMLRNTPANMYSMEDKICYLILGLLLPDPNQRWGYGEIRCWCNNQMIPLVRTGGKINYQYAMPLVLGGKQCWNDKQIAECISRDTSLWTNACYKQICDYLKKNSSRSFPIVDGFQRDDSDTARIFKTIYTLCPAMNGFAWEGIVYRDTQEMVVAVNNKKLTLSGLQNLLRNDCLSFFERARASLGLADGVDLSEIRAVEQAEKASPGEGASRCILLFTTNKKARTFTVDGNTFGSVSDLLKAYKGRENRLKQISSQMISNSSFQAWLWANGLEKLGKEAERSVKINPNNAFPICLTLLEKSASSEQEKKAVREIFLMYGDLAPIAWLFGNINYYVDETGMNRKIYERFKNVRLDLNKSVQELNDYLSDYVRDYQQFVQSTLDNPLTLEFGRDPSVRYDFRPMYDSGFFCQKWNDMLDVCPAFLHSVNSPLDEQRIRSWLSTCADRQREILGNRSSLIDVKDTTWAAEYLDKVKKNYSMAIVMPVVAVILMVVSFSTSVGLALLSFAVAIIYPLVALTWYHTKKVRAERWYRTYTQQADNLATLNSMTQLVGTRETAIFQQLKKNVKSECVVKDQGTMANSAGLDDLEALDVPLGHKILGFLSLTGYVILATLIWAKGDLNIALPTGIFYAAEYGLGVALYFRKEKYLSSCQEWTLMTCGLAGLALIGGVIFGVDSLGIMAAIPICIVGIILGFMVVCAFMGF